MPPKKNQGRVSFSRTHLGVTKGKLEKYGDWQFEFFHKQVGTTIRRDLFSVQITGTETFEKVFLTNYSTLRAARNAAFVKVGELAEKYATIKEKHRVDIQHSLVKQKRLKKIANLKQKLKQPES